MVFFFICCYLVFYFLSVSLINNYVSLRYIQLSLGNKFATFLGKICQLCLSSVHFGTAKLYLSVFPFGVGSLMWL